MNRIRKYNDKWQVLHTPTHLYNTSYEILRGEWNNDPLYSNEYVIGWNDSFINSFYVKEYDTLQEASCDAFNMPDINWSQLVIMFKSDYHKIGNYIYDIITKNKYHVEYISTYLNPEEAKNTMFNRVINGERSFVLADNFNDVISYDIIGHSGKVNNEIANKIINSELRITKKITKFGIICLIGETDVGTTFEIKLWPALIRKWALWVRDNPNVTANVRKTYLEKVLKSQNDIDNNLTFI